MIYVKDYIRPYFTSDVFKRIALIQILAGGAFLSSFTYIAILANEVGLSRTGIVIMAMLYSFAQFFSSYIFGGLS